MNTINQALRRIETYRGEASLLTWIYQLARSQLSAHFRREAKHQPVILIEDSEPLRAEVENLALQINDSPESELAQAQRGHRVRSMLDHLPGNYGDLLELKYIDGLSVQEIAARLDSTPVAVQSFLARARKAFKEGFEKVQAQMGELAPISAAAGGSERT